MTKPIDQEKLLSVLVNYLRQDNPIDSEYLIAAPMVPYGAHPDDSLPDLHQEYLRQLWKNFLKFYKNVKSFP